MKRLYKRVKYNFQKNIIRFRESDYDFIRLHLGTNSIGLVLVVSICTVCALRADVLNWNYLKGVNHDLSFFICLFSIVLGVGFYKFWRLGEKSVYSFHFVKRRFLPKGVYIMFTYHDFSFGISSQIKIQSDELSSFSRGLMCIGIFFSLALTTLDNGGFDKLKKLPSEMLESTSEYCPEKEEGAEEPLPKEGCALIIRAYNLGYAKDLGTCEPDEIEADMEICEKRRKDEPYLHYMSRLLIGSVENKIDFFDEDKIKKIRDKFDLQLQQLEVLKDYQSYAISASPRASHHIWTNLPYPENIFHQKYREIFRPSYCIEQFQKQTNTIRLEKDDKRKDSKVLEHVYGQLLFNPKSNLTVGFCKEYEMHWDSEPDICERLAKNPKAMLEEVNILSEVELVLRRHDIANVVLNLQEEMKKIESAPSAEEKEETNTVDKKKKQNPRKTPKQKIVKSKIAKDKQQFRKKNELVSFQCFMQENDSVSENTEHTFELQGTNFLVRTRYFPAIERKGESQISMYREFSRALENRFHYSQLSSRSDINIEESIAGGVSAGDKHLLEEPSYLFSRLEILKNMDIFLGNKWILERDDLLGVYPYHVHLQNYVKSFRVEYDKSRGRL